MPPFDSCAAPLLPFDTLIPCPTAVYARADVVINATAMNANAVTAIILQAFIQITSTNT
jgi:hypothetical protein